MGIEYNGGPRVLNTLTGATQTFAVGSTGTDFAIVSSGTAHTFNIPDASATARGLITTGSQAIAGGKTFTGTVNINTSGAVVSSITSTTSGMSITGGGLNSTTAGIALGSSGTGAYSFHSGDSNSGTGDCIFFSSGSPSSVLGTKTGTGAVVSLRGGGLKLSNSASIGWSVSHAGRETLSTTDLYLSRDAAGTLAQRNGTNVQSLGVYGTYTSSTSYERVNVRGKASASFEIGPENGSGGGILRGLTIGGYTTGSTSITPWLTFNNTGAASFTSSVNLISTGTVDAYAAAATVKFRRANGSLSSPAQVGSGGTIGLIASYGYHDGAAFHTGIGAFISFVSAEAYTTTSQATSIRFATTATGATTATTRLTLVSDGTLTFEDASNIALGTTTGTKIGTSTSQKLSFWNATPVVQQTTAVTAATFTGVGGTGVATLDTFDGYTIGQIVAALRAVGILA